MHTVAIFRDQIRPDTVSRGQNVDSPHQARRGFLATCQVSHAMLAALGLETARVAVIDQGIEVAIGNRPDMAAATTVAAIGTTEFLVFLVAERSAAIAAVARSDVDERFVYKFHGDCTRKSGDAHGAPGCRRLHH